MTIVGRDIEEEETERERERERERETVRYEIVRAIFRAIFFFDFSDGIDLTIRRKKIIIPSE